MDQRTELESLLDSALELDEQGRFADALALLDKVLKDGPRRLLDPLEEAWVRFERGACLDRFGRSQEADVEFRLAEKLAPEEYPAPLRLGAEEFDRLVAEALDAVPERFDPFLSQVMVAVRDYPGASDPDPHLLGLYVGVPRTERTQELADHLDQIFVFKRNLELDVLDRDELREEIRKTVIHEIAHHFGMGEEDMGDYA